MRAELVRDGSHRAVRSANNSKDVALLAREIIGNADREHFLVLGRRTDGKIVASHTVSIGTESQTLVSRAIIYRTVLLMAVENFIVVHNHPSGIALPSHEDIMTTKKLKDGADVVGLHLLDHIILGDEKSYYSFFENGNL